MIILAIDPGSEQSAWVLYDTEARKPLDFGIHGNVSVLELMRHDWTIGPPTHLVVEFIQSMGMAVGQTVFDTCYWVGRFVERWDRPFSLIKRHKIKMHLCGSTRAKDTNIIASICNRYGGDIRAAKGTKAAPGPLYGFRKDIWQALAVAITCAETREALKEKEKSNG